MSDNDAFVDRVVLDEMVVDDNANDERDNRSDDDDDVYHFYRLFCNFDDDDDGIASYEILFHATYAIIKLETLLHEEALKHVRAVPDRRRVFAWGAERRLAMSSPLEQQLLADHYAFKRYYRMSAPALDGLVSIMKQQPIFVERKKNKKFATFRNPFIGVRLHVLLFQRTLAGSDPHDLALLRKVPLSTLHQCNDRMVDAVVYLTARS